MLAIRKCDVDVTRTPATVRICGTIVSRAGKPSRRQPHPKTAKSTRTVSVPSFTAAVVRERLVVVGSEDPEHLLFFSRNHTPLTTNNIRRRLRNILAEAGITGVTPHSFRRTVATVIDRAGGADLAAEMLGHTSSKITKQHYIEPDETVDPVTAEILESLAPRKLGGPMNEERHTPSRVEGKGYGWVVDTELIYDWLMEVDEGTYDQIIAALEILADQAPGLGRPLVDSIVGSRHKNMKELRPGSSGRSEVRILFAFDPKRRAILLLAGDKQGTWARWYRRNVPIADDRYDEHLGQLKGGQ